MCILATLNCQLSFSTHVFRMCSSFIIHSHIRVPFSHTPTSHTDGRLNLGLIWACIENKNENGTEMDLYEFFRISGHERPNLAIKKI